MSDTSSPGNLAATRLADLLASDRTLLITQAVTGIVTGPGNNGTAGTVLLGHAGTPGTFLGLPRAPGSPGIGGGKPQ